ncbi:hypothetical protein [Pectinatus cerevisiiphilus]|uniref:Uncharacterized protein n=1 Tax=Pectinatus cerevisiiphilus TaxID=86956 RepID=A0A4R3KD78_9FIRM|nr:hypothetical protein [Pectinatus cerevisiiphilus]TCS80973.1 hypothetical protein EDC37_103143 [Pectinatus cerevisiiphilus]
MSVNPIGNLQAMLPNSSEVGNIQNKMNHQVVTAQNFGNEKLQQESEKKQLQVYARENVEDGKIKDEQKGSSGNGGNSSKKHREGQPDENKKEQVLTDAVRGHNIDIKL